MRNCRDYNQVPHTDKNGMIYWVRENCQCEAEKGSEYCLYHQPTEPMGVELSQALARMQATVKRKHKAYFSKPKDVRQPLADP